MCLFVKKVYESSKNLFKFVFKSSNFEFVIHRFFYKKLPIYDVVAKQNVLMKVIIGSPTSFYDVYQS